MEAKRITDKGGFMLNQRVNGTCVPLTAGVLAVTRSLGDFTMKDFVLGTPYTTSIELGAHDEFVIIACDGVRHFLTQLWDVVSDQGAVDMVSPMSDAQAAADKLLQHALDNMSTDNMSILVVRL